MTTDDLKIYAINTGAMAFSFTAVESTLKIIALLVTIGYTATKWATFAIAKRKNKEQE